MGRRKIHDEALRLRLLDAAGQRLTAGGPDALNLRQLAAEAGTSTTAVYSLFGSKADLVQALLAEGFRRLRQHLDSVPPHDDPAEHLVRLAHAYRASALADPHYYRVMFEVRHNGEQISDEVAELGSAAFQPLLEGVQRCLDDKIFEHPDAKLVATALWADVHGLVSLELSRLLGEGYDNAAFETVIRTGLRGWRANLS